MLAYHSSVQVYLLLVKVGEEAAAFLKSSQDLFIGAVSLQVMIQITHQFLAHLTEATILQLSDLNYTRGWWAQCWQGLPDPRGAPSCPAPHPALTGHRRQPCAGAEAQHAALHLRADLLQQDGKDGAAICVHHLLALF
ncbi:hypothetical protein P7K49_040777 [Saguinus oedipus]|uniref:Uncharacterized protein n=1 Tax=Saguinus oedipus TaxID=9490 RepID=A0ABQ9T908_SAGOE|nr:hypothetical protein P7K49_040777 [Saguinus oedipus]